MLSMATSLISMPCKPRPQLNCFYRKNMDHSEVMSSTCPSKIIYYIKINGSHCCRWRSSTSWWSMTPWMWRKTAILTAGICVGCTPMPLGVNSMLQSAFKFHGTRAWKVIDKKPIFLHPIYIYIKGGAPNIAKLVHNSILCGGYI